MNSLDSRRRGKILPLTFVPFSMELSESPEKSPLRWGDLPRLVAGFMRKFRLMVQELLLAPQEPALQIEFGTV